MITCEMSDFVEMTIWNSIDQGPFLQRVINAGGNIEREMAVGNGRCDLLVEYGDERHVIELKLYYDEFSREDGIEQIVRYLDCLGMDKGYFILFETHAGIPWEQRIVRQELEVEGKRVVLLGK